MASHSTGGELGTDRRRLLDLIMRGDAGGLARARIGRRSGRERVASSSQEAMLLFERVASGTAVHNLASALRLRGALDVPALRGALTEILRRHEILRTTYGRDGSVRVLAPELALAELSGDPDGSSGRRAAAERFAADLARSPIDPFAGPPVRFGLAPVSDAEHVLALVCHHVAYDGWSHGVFLGELSTLYSDLLRGPTPSLPEPELQFADYAEWQRQGVATHEDDLRFWQSELSADTPPLELPASRPFAGPGAYRGGTLHFAVPPADTRAARELARRSSTSLFAVLMAVYHVLLARLAGQRDIVVGTAVANRPSPELEPVVGPFVNTLAIRSRARMDEPFDAHLDRVSAACRRAIAHSGAPFESVVKAVNPPRVPGALPLYQTLLVLQNFPLPPLAMPGLESEEIPVHSGASRFDLSIVFEPRAEGLSASVEFDADRFDEERIRWIAGSFGALLRSALEAPACRLGRLSQEPAEARPSTPNEVA